MNIELKTKCGQDILNTQDRIERIKRTIESVTNGMGNKDYSASLELRIVSHKRGANEHYHTISKENILSIINRSLNEEESYLSLLNKQYDLIN